MSTDSQITERPQSVKDYLALPAYKSRFGEVLSSRAPQFMASLINLSQDRNLARCEPRSVIASAMVAAVLEFPIEKALGFCHIIAYGDVAQFQMAAKGYVQLALRSGQYQRLNAKPVNIEAIGGYDEVGEPEINWSLLDETKPAVGYVVAWKLVNGFVKRAYWSKAKVEDHASRFSQAYKKKKMDSPWFTNFDKMAIKTVLMNELRTYGPLSVQMQTAMKHDYAVHTDIDAEPQYIDNATEVTGTATPDEPQPVQPRTAAPARSKKGAAAVVENPPAQSKGGTVVEGEFTEGPKGGTQTPAPDGEKTPEPEKPKERTAAEQKILDDLKAKQDAAIKAKTEAAKEQAAKPEGNPTSRTALADGEVITVNAEIIDVASMMGKFKGNETPLVQAQLKNGFDGLVLHFGGGKMIDPKTRKVEPDPLYEVGSVRRFTIRGMINKAANPPKVSHLVDKIEEAAPDAATEMG